ncbi:hypothetical protein ATY41_03185 [Leifsonia xyli subsp. xyli]|uniref:Penicillin-binding protein transpeptidase domain-containing protein n=2 Tax=Leifsonia xyli subsp. xyli TaxID=59736 RepID=Q6ACC1_LEIXX|nr:hypothetical protein [Leifsonia xyli]AAT89972.1 hypothetical protein Lxx23160 [Leifsonia xyli subsp. xyli str. CTCB07]ODA90046.1 hypothetical protein ATY41_03185 [Leifsonia xyli subsp. xyli]
MWIGNVQGEVSLRRSTIGGVQGDQLRNRVWKTYMTAANAKYGGEAFPASVAQPVRVTAPAPTTSPGTRPEG